MMKNISICLVLLALATAQGVQAATSRLGVKQPVGFFLTNPALSKHKSTNVKGDRRSGVTSPAEPQATVSNVPSPTSVSPSSMVSSELPRSATSELFERFSSSSSSDSSNLSASEGEEEEGIQEYSIEDGEESDDAEITNMLSVPEYDIDSASEDEEEEYDDMEPDYAARLIQSLYRGYRDGNNQRRMLAREKEAAELIQKNYRDFSARKKLAAEKQERRSAEKPPRKSVPGTTAPSSTTPLLNNEQKVSTLPEPEKPVLAEASLLSNKFAETSVAGQPDVFQKPATEKLEQEVIDEADVVITEFLDRGNKDKRMLAREKEAALLVQKNYRGFITRKKLAAGKEERRLVESQQKAVELKNLELDDKNHSTNPAANAVNTEIDKNNEAGDAAVVKLKTVPPVEEEQRNNNRPEPKDTQVSHWQTQAVFGAAGASGAVAGSIATFVPVYLATKSMLEKAPSSVQARGLKRKRRIGGVLQGAVERQARLRAKRI